MRLWQFNKRIGVVGMFRSGKTVFLTSLINHLSRHDPARFPLGDGRVRLTGFKRLPAEPGWDDFDYEACRNALITRQRWPEKTLANRQFRLRLNRSDWPYTGIELCFMDLAGERLADVPMASCGYETWSDAMWRRLATDSEYQPLARDYLALAGPENPEALEEKQVLHSYRLALARCCLAYLPVISPSSLLLGSGGDYVREREPEEIAAKRLVGLDEQSQFAPLSEEARRKNPRLASEFARRYQNYRKKLVLPFASWLADCHQLVILTDITSLLAAGLGAYHGAQHMLQELIDWVEPGRSDLGRMASLLFKPLSGGRLSLPGVTRMALVASKADKVHAKQRQKLLGLLRQMSGYDLENISGERQLRVGYFACAGVNSTASRPDGSLEGRLVGQGQEMRSFRPSDLPDQWPADWQAGQYNFPDVWPQVPPRRDMPPNQIGLNAVADFILADNQWTE